MKKTIIFLVTILLFSLNGCEKKESYFNSVLSLRDELNSLANSQVEGSLQLDPCYNANPYDAWGEALYIGLTKITESTLKSGSILDVNQKFEDRLSLMIPNEYLHLDTLNVDRRTVKALCDEFLSMYIKRNIFESLVLAKKMENHIVQSTILNNDDKAYILKFVSLIRYSTYYNYSENSLRKKTDFETCWKRKLQAIQDSGFFHRVACALDWPMCLGVAVADCVLEVLGWQ
jgi:hypothetical protein